jgi:hypothetical protein
MLEEIKRHKNKWRETDFPDESAQGMFCPTPTLMRNDFPGELSSNAYGTMFLNMHDLKERGDEILIHECAHAAFCYDQSVLRLNAGYEDMAIQEHYCYTQGELIKAVRRALDDNRKWRG